MNKTIFSLLGLFLLSCGAFFLEAQTREVITLKKGWKFNKGQHPNATKIDFNDAKWETVTVPHDWAIYGPFDKEIDKQTVAITQNGENIATEKTGRTGALPYIGEAWYRNTFSLENFDDSKKVLLLFEGAMSEPEIFLNGKKVGEWKYGYSYFYFDVSKYINDTSENTLAVKLTNVGKSSRWYPGAGLYRNVRLIVKDKESFEQWSTFITTPSITEDEAKSTLRLKPPEQT